VPEWRLTRRSEPLPEEMREPSFREAAYSTSNDTVANMYTPGIGAGGSQRSSRNAPMHEQLDEAPRRNMRRSPAGGIFKAICLIFACAVVSAAATYGVMEYRVRNGYHTVVNQVVLGNTGIGLRNNGAPTPIAAQGERMAPEDIYDLALTQVVGIQTRLPTVGSFGTVGTNTVSGSGFIITTDGYILTNYHVIETAQNNNLPITVTMSDGAEFEATVIGYEQSNDVALIKIDVMGLNPVMLGNSDNIRVGQSIFAIGNPFGNLVYTMTDGIVSALDRDVTLEGRIVNTFQFSAAVNTGNSGGPIYDSNGEVIGIVTAKFMRGNVEGIGFAIPINDAIEIASGLIEHGYIAGRPLLGVTIQTVTTGYAEYYDWVVGVRVRTVNPGSAAENAGLEIGDIIVGLGSSEVTSIDTLRFAMRRYRAGDTAIMQVWREGRTFDMEITFDEDLAAGRPGRSARP
ncbi:MAG: S1C family serine protease, partial [Oscillospiraceae bacterium]|nr:S1C family serine protease [Oscillospiraceae bacterium]